MVAGTQPQSAVLLQDLDSHTAGVRAQTGCFLLAVPMVVYGVEHFIYANFVAAIVPSWIPWHFFWTYFVGIALIAAGFGMVLKKQQRLAGILLGAMIFSFVILIHTVLLVHGLSASVNNTFGSMAAPLNNCFKDLGLSGAAFIFAGVESESWRRFESNKLLALGRAIFAISIIAFGMLHFLYPTFMPGLQSIYTGIPSPIPSHLFWVYLTGIVLLVAGVCVLLNRNARIAAIWLAIAILLFDVFTWFPRFASHPSDLTGNWLKDVGLAGGALILAGGLSKES
jgi:uncharacterized membrane protein